MHNEQKVTKSVYWIGSNDFITPRFDNYIPLEREFRIIHILLMMKRPVFLMRWIMQRVIYSWGM